MSDDLDVDNVSKNDKSSISDQIRSPDSKLTYKNRKETIDKQMPLTARCKSDSKPISVVSCYSNAADGKLIVNHVARNSKTYFPERETSSVSKSASENIKSFFSNKPILVQPSSVAKHDSAICSNVIVDDNDDPDSKVECNKSLSTETRRSESSLSIASVHEKQNSVDKRMIN